MTPRPQSDAEYAATQALMMILARKLSGLPLEPFLERIATANAVAPIVDPTLFRQGAQNLRNVEAIARALQAAQRATAEPLAQLQDWAAIKLAELAE